MKDGKRIFSISQYEKHPITGEDLGFNEEVIKKGLERKSITKFAYSPHYDDKYSAEDEAQDRERLKAEYDRLLMAKDKSLKIPDPSDKRKRITVPEAEYIETHLVKRAGGPKPRHWHVNLYCKNPVLLETISEWFNVPSQYIDIPNSGRGGKRDAFLDCVEYLTHESDKAQAQGKTLYPDDNVRANFDWRGELAAYKTKLAKYGQVVSNRDEVALEVAYNGMTLKTVRNNHKEVWIKDMTTLKKLRADYLASQPSPIARMNFYITGDGRCGKGLLSRAIARTLCPNLDDDECFFEVGAKGVNFENYDGQPVIIWNDCRSFDLITKLGGRDNVFNVFDTHPTRQKQNVKHSYTSLLNHINIVNSVQDYREFLDGLAGEYRDRHGNEYLAEDKRQSYERFPVIIPINADDFELLFNCGYFYSWSDFEQYQVEVKLKANMKRIAMMCRNNKELENRLNGVVLQPIESKLVSTIEKVGEVDEAEVMAEFNALGYGQVEYPERRDEKEHMRCLLGTWYEEFCNQIDNAVKGRPGRSNRFPSTPLERWTAFRDDSYNGEYMYYFDSNHRYCRVDALPYFIDVFWETYKRIPDGVDFYAMCTEQIEPLEAKAREEEKENEKRREEEERVRREEAEREEREHQERMQNDPDYRQEVREGMMEGIYKEEEKDIGEAQEYWSGIFAQEAKEGNFGLEVAPYEPPLYELPYRFTLTDDFTVIFQEEIEAAKSQR